MASADVEKAIEQTLRSDKRLDSFVRDTLRGVVRRTGMNEGVLLMMERWREFDEDPLRALLVGALMDPGSRTFINDRLDSRWGTLREYGPEDTSAGREVIVGGGLHAAIYCATRAARAREAGVPIRRPIVLEAGERVGGVFALTRGPSFYLNSRNSAGGQGVPGESGALNYLPNTPLQPFDLGNSVFQTNTQLADVIRLTLALYADVYPGQRVSQVKKNSLRGYDVYTNDDGDDPVLSRVARIVYATGLGEEVNLFKQLGIDSKRVLTYSQFMARMDTPFPLRGLGRVAVIGGGDGGKTAIEGMTGLGPPKPMASATLDALGRIDWWGAGGGVTPNTWCEGNRGRYRAIGSLFKQRPDGQRVRPLGTTSYFSVSGDDVAFVDGRPYDHVIVAAGYTRTTPVIPPGYFIDNMNMGGVTVGNQAFDGNGATAEIYAVGPGTNLELSAPERLTDASRVPENRAAIFRYAPRTAALAASFPVQ